MSKTFDPNYYGRSDETHYEDDGPIQSWRDVQDQDGNWVSEPVYIDESEPPAEIVNPFEDEG